MSNPGGPTAPMPGAGDYGSTNPAPAGPPMGPPPAEPTPWYSNPYVIGGLVVVAVVVGGLVWWLAGDDSSEPPTTTVASTSTSTTTTSQPPATVAPTTAPPVTTATPPPATTPQRGPRGRVSFPPGGFGTTLNDFVTTGETATYILEAAAGQTMSLTLRSGGAPVFDVFSPSGTQLVVGAGSDDVFLPEDGDYQVDVRSPGGDAAYELTISIA